MQNATLIFILSPALSHQIPIVEMAKLLVDRDDRLSITVLIMKQPNDSVVDNYVNKMIPNSNPNSRLCFINLPDQEYESSDSKISDVFDFIDNQIPHIRDTVSDLMNKSSVAGIVVDMFCTKFVDVANEFGLASYVFFLSGACQLCVSFHLLMLKLELNQELTQYKNSDVELSIPCFSNPVPAKVLPSDLVDDGPMADIFLGYLKRFSETTGLIVNTFYELESQGIQYLSNGKIPKVYPVGPILNLSIEKDSHGSGSSSSQSDSGDEIKNWLDNQPESSVVFLCFGIMGSFGEAQVKEIASALEKTKHRFLWSLRKPGPMGKMKIPTAYEDFEEVLPEGFLERTKGIGKVIGWAPQVAVLSHPAVGGFVSHCGWNSTLESLWYGVPMATFPLYADQQLIAFELVKELGVAEAIRIDYSINSSRENDEQEIVRAEEIEAAIHRLMADDGSGGVRHKVKEMQKKSRMALVEGGSSYNAMNLFIEDVIKNIA